MKVQEFLRDKHVPFEVMMHSATYDSQHMAHELHVSGHDVAKTVLLRLDEQPKYAVAVLPASRRLDLDKAAHALGSNKAALADELQLKKKCPDCEPGALPPFGSCYGMLTLADDTLGVHDEIVFEANSHDESLRMNYSDYCQLEHPIIASITRN